MARGQAVVLAGVTMVIAAGYGALSVWRHAHFATNGHDLGIFDQAMWALSRFQAPATTVRHTPLPSLFGDHFHPVLLVLVPGYWLFASPVVLLVAQALLLAAVVPLGFLLARQLGMPPWPAVALSVALGAHPGFTTAALFEFHEVAFAPALLLATVLLAERRRWGWYWLALALLLATKETMALYAALFGVTLTLRRQWTIGLATLGVGLGYFLVVTGVVMPAIADQRMTWHTYAELGDSPRQVVEHVVRHPVASVQLLFSTPEKRRTIHLLFASFAYLPVVSWTVWPMIAMTLAERFWSIRPELWVFRYHYEVVVTTVLFVATLYVLRDAGRRRPRRDVMAAGAALLLIATTAWAAWASGAWRNAFDRAPAGTVERWRAALRQVPAGARVSAQGAFVPHLSHRPTIYQFPRVRDAEYVLLDPQSSPWPVTEEAIRAAQEGLGTLGWDAIWRRDTATLFRRTAGAGTLPAPTYWE